MKAKIADRLCVTALVLAFAITAVVMSDTGKADRADLAGAVEAVKPTEVERIAAKSVNDQLRHYAGKEWHGLWPCIGPDLLR
jgi:hypothetical protein